MSLKRCLMLPTTAGISKSGDSSPTCKAAMRSSAPVRVMAILEGRLRRGKSRCGSLVAPCQSPALLVRHPLLALHDAADGVASLAATLQDKLRLLELLRRHDQDHADAHVEGAQHLVAGHIADLLQVLEDGWHRPGVDLDDRSHALGQHARKVLGEAAAGDVRHG